MKVRFGVCADLHTEFMHDAPARMEKFLAACEESGCDFAFDGRSTVDFNGFSFAT